MLTREQELEKLGIERKKKILLVEDEAIIGLNESVQLISFGYDVTHVLSGESALEVIHTNGSLWDLVLMDIDLGGGLDGPATALLILEDFDIPIIFLSSHVERSVVDTTQNISSFGYVVKSSNIAVLDASIKMAFRLHIAHSALKKQKKEIDTKNTQLEFHEKRYRRLFESAQDGILILNSRNGMIVDVNPYLVKMLGYSKEEMLEKQIWDISAFKYIDYSKQLFLELQSKEYVRYTDLPLETLDKRIIHVEFVSNVYLVDDEKVILCNIRDIEDRIRRENDLMSNIDKSRALLKEIQHRTKNSFTMITSLISLRANESDCEETRLAFAELRLRVQSISDLYSLLYSTDSFYEVPFKLYCNTLIDSMLNLAANVVIRKEIEEMSLSAKDAANFGMIIVELMSNSIKYAFPDKKSGILSILIKKEDDQIKLTVEDNGIGINQSLDRNLKRGIGLHIVDLLVKQLEASIEFIPVDGTKVIITMKVHKFHKQDASPS